MYLRHGKHTVSLVFPRNELYVVRGQTLICIDETSKYMIMTNYLVLRLLLSDVYDVNRAMLVNTMMIISDHAHNTA